METTTKLTDIEHERGRLRFRAWHRGTREMDLLLGSFADTHIMQWNSIQLAEFAAIIAEADVDLYDWYIGRAPIADNMAGNAVLALFQQHRFAA